jgi:hypothetical protein
MRTTAIGTGSVADQVNAVAILLQGLPDRAAVEYRWSRIVRALEAVRTRCGAVRCRGGRPVGVDGPMAWLDQVVRGHPALQEPGAEPLRAELLALIGSIAR